jgi:Big-like domain-containing protein
MPGSARLAGALLATAALCAVGAPAAQAKPASARQEVSLNGVFDGTTFAGGALSRADGRDPRGFVHLAGIGYNFDATVTCLAVSGNLATIGFRIDAGQHPGEGFVMTVQDNGPTVPGFVPTDRMIFTTVASPPSSCPPPVATGLSDALGEGEIVVTPAGGPKVRNQRPQAHDDTATAGVPVPANVDVLANDTDPDPGDALTVSSFTQGRYGAVACRAGGACMYTPGPRSATQQHDSFRYVARDPEGAHARGTVQITLRHHADAVSVTGNATAGTETLYASASFSAVSGPSGEDPTDSGSFFAFGFPTAGPVTCLRVTGNTAILHIDDIAFYGQPVNVELTDNGGHGLDTIDVSGGGPPDCSSFTGNGPSTRRMLDQGRAIVFDAQP